MFVMDIVIGTPDALRMATVPEEKLLRCISQPRVTRNPKPEALNPKPKAPRPKTLKPETLN